VVDAQEHIEPTRLGGGLETVDSLFDTMRALDHDQALGGTGAACHQDQGQQARITGLRNQHFFPLADWLITGAIIDDRSRIQEPRNIPSLGTSIARREGGDIQRSASLV
jgi:hypothetical protein